MVDTVDHNDFEELQETAGFADIIHRFRVLNLTSDKGVVYSGKAR
jgi:hypothetical protein